MNKSFSLQESNVRQPGGGSASLQILGRILRWLVGLFQLTDREQDDAGIYLGDPYSNDKEKT